MPKQQEKSARLIEVKVYQSILEGEQIRVVMYRKGVRYGVVSLFKETAVARDYRNADTHNELRTFIGNEENIIDWVSAKTSNQRYNDLLIQLLLKEKSHKLKIGIPHLKIVSSNE